MPKATVMQTKTLGDVKADMSDLYEQVRRGETGLRAAGELSNIAGKYLKAAQLELACEVFRAARAERSITSGLINDT